MAEAQARKKTDLPLNSTWTIEIKQPTPRLTKSCNKEMKLSWALKTCRAVEIQGKKCDKWKVTAVFSNREDANSLLVPCTSMWPILMHCPLELEFHKPLPTLSRNFSHLLTHVAPLLESELRWRRPPHTGHILPSTCNLGLCSSLL